MKRILIIVVILLVSSCSEKEQSKKLKIAVTNYPVYWLVETISGGSVDIIYNVPAGIDPAYWKPKDSDITAMQEADLILLNGATYEKWLTSVEIPSSITVNTSKAGKSKFIIIKDAEVHEHNGVKHSHDGIDFNIWLDPEILTLQADEVLKQLVKLKPEMAEAFTENHKTLVSEVKSVFAAIKESASKENNYFASHPVYDYLARANGWKVKNFHWEPDTMPSEAEWKKLEDSLSYSKFMLYEDSPSLTISEKLKSIGIKVIVFRTGGNTPPSKDLIEEMKANLKNLKSAVEK